MKIKKVKRVRSEEERLEVLKKEKESILKEAFNELKVDKNKSINK